jgi:hypothetical protein
VLTARRAIGREGPYVFAADSASGHLEEPRFALDGIAEATGTKASIHDPRRTFVTVAEACDIPHALAIPLDFSPQSRMARSTGPRSRSIQVAR